MVMDETSKGKLTICNGRDEPLNYTTAEPWNATEQRSPCLVVGENDTPGENNQLMVCLCWG